ncbi:hypothetical protein CTI12_AA046190 [Artemisia annua]|uniref:Myb/SANT-like domain-containing protein n=1 Tax=Artemisia annua TaxID=35608 RepID=A0A2U1QCF3_ARTAN|nr:hypothetical protein CTI12_AA046190 [Artemisia annua]
MAGIIGGGKSKYVWSKEEDTLLVDALMKLHVSGQYVYADIEPEYFHAVQRLLGPEWYSAKPIKIRMKYFKKHFNIVHDMLVGTHMSGFRWDPEKLCVIADDQVWEEYIKKHADAAQFRNQPFPHYDKLHTIFCKDIAKHHQADGLGGEDEGIVEENQLDPCLEAKDLHVSGNVSSFYGYRESVGGSKRKRDEHNGPRETCVESLDVLKNTIENFGRVFFENMEKVANQRINASNELMDKVMNQINDLYALTDAESLKAMSVIGRSASLFRMFDRLDKNGKVLMAQMVANGSIS